MDYIAERVIHYMSDADSAGDKNPHFAIAMYGEWGSGKTHYCETSLREALKRKKYKLIRISLFGVDSPNGIYGRLLSALCRMEGSKAKRMGKLAAETVANTFISTLHDHGIDLALDTETLVSLIPAEKTLIVLDDGERVNTDEDGKTPSWVIGIVNNMVENLHWHVMLIRNTPFDLEKGQTEKIVGEQLPYVPTTEELYDAMVAPRLKHQNNLDIDIRAASVSGIQASGILNARAAARIVDSLNVVLDTEAICDTAFAGSGRQQALTDVIQQMMLAASGNAPTDPDQEKSKSDRRQYGHDLLLSRTSSELKDIIGPISKGNVPEPRIVNHCLEFYLKTEYPTSPEDQAVKDLEDELESYPLMDDSDMAILAVQFRKAIERHAFGPQQIYRVWKGNKLLNKFGFDEAMPLQDAKRAMRQVIDSDPLGSYDSLHHEYLQWMDGSDMWIDDLNEPNEGQSIQDNDLDDLVDYAKHKVRESDETKATTRAIDAEAGSRLSKELLDIMNSPLPALGSIPPDQFVKIFIIGNAKSQIALHKLFSTELLQRFLVFDTQSLSSWLYSIEEGLTKQHALSRMGARRQKWLLDDIHEIQAKIETAKASADQ